MAAYLGLEAGEAPSAEQEEQLQRLQLEAEAFSLASHLYWGVWALLQVRFHPAKPSPGACACLFYSTCDGEVVAVLWRTV